MACEMLVGGTALSWAGMRLMAYADRRGVSFGKMTLLVLAAAICFISAAVLLLLGIFQLAAAIWNIGGTI